MTDLQGTAEPPGQFSSPNFTPIANKEFMTFFDSVSTPVDMVGKNNFTHKALKRKLSSEDESEKVPKPNSGETLRALLDSKDSDPEFHQNVANDAAFDMEKRLEERLESCPSTLVSEDNKTTLTLDVIAPNATSVASNAETVCATTTTLSEDCDNSLASFTSQPQSSLTNFTPSSQTSMSYSHMDNSLRENLTSLSSSITGSMPHSVPMVPQHPSQQDFIRSSMPSHPPPQMMSRTVIPPGQQHMTSLPPSQMQQPNIGQPRMSQVPVIPGPGQQHMLPAEYTGNLAQPSYQQGQVMMASTMQPPPFNPMPRMRLPSEAQQLAPSAPQQQISAEKKKLIQQQLALLLHAHQCQRREPNNGEIRCPVPHCQVMRNVLAHMHTCTAGKNCQEQHCVSSRHIIMHWRTCSRAECPICGNFKRHDRPPTSQNFDLFANGMPNNEGAAIDMQNVYDILGIQQSTQEPQPSFPQLSAPPHVKPVRSMYPPPTMNHVPMNGGMMPSVSNPTMMVNSGPMMMPPGIPPFPPPTPGANNQGFMPLHDQKKAVQSWHLNVTTDLRAHLIRKLVETIFPLPDDLSQINDTRIMNLVNYAKGVESDMFHKADSIDNYYQILAVKIYKIKKELEQKQKLKVEMRAVNSDPNSNRPPSATTGIVSPRDQFPNLSDASGTMVKNEPLSEIKTEPQQLAAAKKSPAPLRLDSIKPEPSFEQDDSKDFKPRLPLSAHMSPNKVKPPRLKEFTTEELRDALMPTLETIYRLDPESIPFQCPVPREHIPDYYDIIKHPMDLSTIKRKLDCPSAFNAYKDPWEYISDMYLMFNNAFTYNKKTSRIYKFCLKLKEVFESEIDEVMQGLGFCCGHQYVYTPQVLCCSAQQLCTIPRGASYFCYQNKYFCEKCFTDVKGDEVEITVTDDPLALPKRISKSCFQHEQNNKIEIEPMVHCKECGRANHKICVLHIDQLNKDGFICDLCLTQKNQKREQKFSSSKLPTTMLSKYLESRVNSFLKVRDTGAAYVTIRVLSSSDKTTEFKPLMKEKFPEEAKEPLPYRSKAIFAFQQIDNVDVMIFGLHVQEYGSDCSYANTRRVYISYLDSVYFFRPRDFRTSTYHQILIGYLAYVQRLGYYAGHIWACPPGEGDDYIFYCHPPEQKIPRPKRLQEWYRRMLDTAVLEGVVDHFTDMPKFADDSKMRSAVDIPYFEGDYWPNTIEDTLREVKKEEEEMASEAASETADDDDSNEGNSERKKGTKNKKSKSKNRTSQRKSMKKSNAPIGSTDLFQRLFSLMEKHKDVFFAIHLMDPEDEPKPICDPDPLINCELMDGRDNFLALAREKRLEFSSLRRAKYSTFYVLYELHTQGQGLMFSCSNCQGQVDTRFHCSTCQDYDLCTACYEKMGKDHEHEMKKIGPEDQQASKDDEKKAQLQKAIERLTHSSQCRDANCKRPDCKKMKQILQHSKQCTVKMQGGCNICRQLIQICCFHAKLCKDQNCSVPFCAVLKNRIAQQKEQRNRQQQLMVERRIAAMHRSNAASSSTNAGQTQQQQPTPHQSPAASQSLSYQPSPAGKPSQDQPMSQQSSQPSPSHSAELRPPIVYGTANPVADDPDKKGLGNAIDKRPLNEAMRQLLLLLKSPQTEERQHRITTLIKNDPELMQCMIRCKQQQSQNNQQRQQQQPPPQHVPQGQGALNMVQQQQLPTSMPAMLPQMQQQLQHQHYQQQQLPQEPIYLNENEMLMQSQQMMPQQQPPPNVMVAPQQMPMMQNPVRQQMYGPPRGRMMSEMRPPPHYQRPQMQRHMMMQQMGPGPPMGGRQPIGIPMQRGPPPGRMAGPQMMMTTQMMPNMVMVQPHRPQMGGVNLSNEEQLRIMRQVQQQQVDMQQQQQAYPPPFMDGSGGQT